MKINLKIEGMTSPCCAQEVKESLLKVKRVKKAFVDFRKGMAEVEIDGKVANSQLIEAVKEKPISPLHLFCIKTSGKAESIFEHKAEIVEENRGRTAIIQQKLQQTTRVR
jgi:copper chaperone CopZ